VLGGDFLLGGFELGLELGEVFLKGVRLGLELGFAGGTCRRLLVDFLDVGACFVDVAEGLNQRLPIFDEGQEVAVIGLLGSEGGELASEIFSFVARGFVLGLEGLDAGAEIVQRRCEGGALFFAFSEEGLKLGGLQQFWAGEVELLLSVFLLLKQ